MSDDAAAAQSALEGLYTAVKYTDDTEIIRDAVSVHTTKISHFFMARLVANMQSLDRASAAWDQRGELTGPMTDAEADELIAANEKLSRDQLVDLAVGCLKRFAERRGPDR
ncbi:hypothetical protein ACTWP6_27370 [Mycobacterium sp. 4D054]|uniref:hypothetical protein n=1 Tax=Mycobacterium sp. 4D054 TaxID=3457440 RepID=UPI003FD5B57B